MKLSPFQRWLSIPPRIPLRFMLAVPFVLQTVGTVALVCYFCYRSTQATSESLAYELIEEVGDRIDQGLKNYLKAPEQINQLNAAAIRDGSLDWTNFTQLEQHFAQQLQILPDASAIAIATEQKEFLSVGKLSADELIIRRLSASTGYQLNNYLADTTGQRQQQNGNQSGIDPHQTPPSDPWYRATKAANQSTWRLVASHIHGEDQPILMAANFLPIYDRADRFQGVVGSAFYLTQLGEFLQQLEIGKTGQAFIVDQAGFLVATSTGEVPFHSDLSQEAAQQLDPARQRLRALDSGDAVTRAATQLVTNWLGEFDQSTRPTHQLAFNFTLNQQRYFLQITPLRHHSQLNWAIVTVVPEADFTATIQQSIENTLLVSVITLLLSVGLSVTLARWLTKPIARLNVAAKQLAQGNFDTTVDSNRPDELGELSRSFDEMVLQLKSAFAGLRVLNRALVDSESKIKQILETLPIGVSMHSPTGAIVYLNATGRQLLGVTSDYPDDLLDMTIADIAQTYHFYYSDTGHLYPFDQLPVVRALRGERVIVNDIEIHRHQQTIPLEVQSTPLFDSYGNVIASINAFQDITDRKTAEKMLADYSRDLEAQVAERTRALADSEERFRRAFDDAGIGMAIASLDGRFLRVNPALCQMLGYTDRELLSRKFHEITHPDDVSQSRQMMHQMDGFNSVKVEKRYVHKQGHVVWVLLSVSLLQDCHQQNLCYISQIQDISDRKRAEEALRQSEERNRAVLSAIPDLITIISGDGIYLDSIRCNASISLVPATINPIGKHVSELVPLDIAERKIQAIQVALSTQEVQTYEQEVWIGDRLQYEESRVVPYGKNAALFMIRDITARRRAEDALRASEERLREIAQTVSQLFFTRSAISGQFLYISPAYQRIWGRSCESLYQDPNSWLEAVHPDDRAMIASDLKKQFEGHSVTRQYRIIQPNGSIRWIYTEITLIRDSAGRPLRFVGLAEDTTDRKRAEEALRQSEAQYRAMVEDQTELVCRFLPDGTLTFVNSTYCQYFGKQPEELIGHTFMPLIPEEDQVIAQANFETLSIDTPFITYEHRVILPNGERRWQQWTDRAIFDEQGHLMEYHAVGRDITERKRAEAELETQQQFLRNIIDVVPSSIFVKDKDGRYLTVNKAGAAMYGRPVEDILGKCDRDFNPNTAQVQEFLANNRQVIEMRQSKMIQAEAVTDQMGETRWYKTVVDPLIDAEGQVQGVIGSSTDITDFKRVEEEMRLAKEVAETASRAKSAFLANMSHELRTPLNAILGFTQLIARDRNLTIQQQDQLKIINRNGEYLLQLINDVLSISKIEAGRITLEEHSFDLYALLDTLEGMFRLRAETKGLRFECQRSPNVPQFIHADERKLRQVITNLLDNAIKFTDRGSVTLHVLPTPHSPLPNPQPPTPNPHPPSPIPHPHFNLLFDVKDTGVGIAASELPTVFDAFVQSESGRKSLHGTGLGLAISRRFVQLMGGEILATSELGQGTSFQFSIAARPVEAETVRGNQHTTRRVVGLANPQSRYRILVADDTDTNRQLMVQWLSIVGFDVREASNGQEAIEQWRQFSPHLIWMDMRMPIMDGFEAVRQIRWKEQELGLWDLEELELRTEQAEYFHSPFPPNCPVPTTIIAITAAVFEEEQQRILAVGCNDIVVKPCSEAIIFEKLAHYLDVAYVYEDKAELNGGSGHNGKSVATVETTDALPCSMLQFMPDEWLQQLNYAARRANEREILQLLEAIPESQTDLKNAIVQLMQRFQLDQLIHLTQPPRNAKNHES